MRLRLIRGRGGRRSAVRRRRVLDEEAPVAGIRTKRLRHGETARALLSRIGLGARARGLLVHHVGPTVRRARCLVRLLHLSYLQLIHANGESFAGSLLVSSGFAFLVATTNETNETLCSSFFLPLSLSSTSLERRERKTHARSFAYLYI